jgi:hypothetical protein
MFANGRPGQGASAPTLAYFLERKKRQPVEMRVLSIDFGLLHLLCFLNSFFKQIKLHPGVEKFNTILVVCGMK